MEFQASVRDSYILRLRHLLLNTFILAFPVPPLSEVYRYFYLPSYSYPPPPHQQTFIVVAALYITRSPRTLPARGASYLDVSHARHPPASAAHICAPRRVPPSDTVSCFHSPPPFSTLGLHPVRCRPLGGFVHRGELHLPSVSSSPSMCGAPLPLIFWFLVSLLGVRFCARIRGQGASTPC